MTTAILTPATPVTAARALPFELGKSVERILTLSRANVDVEARTVALAFASETPVERYWGFEILDCSPCAMRTTRLAAGANILCDHNERDVVGVVEGTTLGADKVARATARFGKSVRASEVFVDVADGIRQNVSVGYIIHAAVLESEKDGVGTYRITDWEPYEISIVSVPADIKVGVGRSAPELVTTEQPPETPPVISTPKETRTMNTENPIAAAPKIETPATRNHAQEIGAIAKGTPALRDAALESIQAGETVEQFQAKAIRVMSSKPVPTADIGLDAKEVRSYSLVRALRAMANPNDAQAQNDAAFERECSRSVEKVMGRAAQGIFMPTDVQKRDLVAATPTGGGNLVATNLLSGSFIDILRNAMVLSKLGIVTLPGLVGKIAIPKQTGSGTAYWVAEGVDPNESQQTIGQVTMNMKTIGAYTEFTRDLLMQSSIAVEQFVQNDLASVVGLGLQQAVINGSGTAGQPAGIMTQVAPSVIGGANGAAPTWAHVVGLETNVSVANADVNTLGYLTNAKVRGKLKTTEKFSTTNGQAIWGDGNEAPLNGYRTAVTNAIPSNIVKGSSSNCSALIYGNFADVVLGLWGSLDLMVDPYALSKSGGVRIVALQSADIALRNAESFATMTDILTA